MFNSPFNTNNNQSINDLEKQLEILRQKQQLNPNNKLGGAFGKLQDFIQNTSKEKIEFANSSDEVIEKYSQMQDIFILFLLENARPQFESWCNDRGINIVNDYVNTFISKTEQYEEAKTNDKIKNLEEQIASLKAQLGVS